MRAMSRIKAIVCLIAVVSAGMAGTSPAAAADFPLADRVLVEKGKRQLHLLKNGIPFRTFKIALGLAPEGDKEQEGDQKTPEGLYMLDARNPDDPGAKLRASLREETDDRTLASRLRGILSVKDPLTAATILDFFLWRPVTANQPTPEHVVTLLTRAGSGDAAAAEQRADTRSVVDAVAGAGHRHRRTPARVD